MDAGKKEITGEIQALCQRVGKLEQVSQDLAKPKNIEDELDKAWREWETTFDATKDSIILTDSDFKIVQANLATSVLFGKNLDEIIGRTCWKLIHGSDKPPKNCPLIKAKDTKTHQEIELYLSEKGIWVETSVSPILNREGNINGVIHILKDITEHKKADDARLSLETELKDILDNTPVGIYRTTPDGRIFLANPALVRMLGYSSFEELAVRNLEKEGFEPQYPRSMFKERIEKDGQIVGLESNWIRRDGTSATIVETAWVVRDKQGRTLYYEGIVQDITERKHADQLLRKEKDRAQKYLDVAAVILVAIDTEQRVGLINKKGCEILGYSEEEIIAKNWFDNFLPKRIKEEMKGVFNKLLCGEADAPEYYENPVLTKDGEERLIAWHNTALRDDKGKVIAALGSGEDITEHKKAEEALRDSEEKYRDLFENAREAIITLDLRGNITGVNKLAEEYGFKREELIEKNFIDFVLEKSRPKATEDFERLAQGNSVYGEMEIVTPIGYRTVEYRDNPIMRGGKIVGVQAILTDITGRKRAEEEIAMLARFPEENPNPILRVSSEGIVLYSNKPALVLLEAWGCRVGQSLPTHLHRFILGALKSGQAHEVEIECGDRLFSIRLVPIVGSNYINIYGREVTIEKLAKQKLIDDQVKLKSLASQLTLAEERERRRLAGELHDRISQSLAISKIKLEALRKSGYGEKLDKALEEICNSIGQTIQDTRTLTFDIGNPILYELGFETAVSHWLTEQIQNKHKIKTEFKDDGEDKLLDDDIRILLFRSVRELLINVVKHARASKVKVSIRKVDNHICVEVEDNGIGFEAEKPAAVPAKTNGFGLFSIRHRLEDLGGHLEIESKPGRGCKVTMTALLKQKETADGRNRATN